MPTNTPRLALVMEASTDNESGFPAREATTYGILDNATLVTEGTFAARPAVGSVEHEHLYRATDTAQWYISDGTNWNVINVGARGATNISTSQSTSSTTFTTLATPDQVTGIVMPTNGLIRVWFWATWQESVTGAGNADIFIGSNQLKSAMPGNTSPQLNPATINNSIVNTNYVLRSHPGGLASAQGLAGSNVGSGPYGGDVTTGQAIGGPFSAILSEFWAGGPCDIFAAAGTYTVSVQFKASSGSVTASNRKLWVQALSFA